MKTETVPVMFRVVVDGGSVIAVFPSIPGDVNGRYVACYSHVGQHSSADMVYVYESTRPARKDEYAAIKKELESAPYHYSLRVIRRSSRKIREAFLAALDR